MSDDLADGVEGVMGLTLMLPGAIVTIGIFQWLMSVLVDILAWMNSHVLAWLVLPLMVIAVLTTAVDDDHREVKAGEKVYFSKYGNTRYYGTVDHVDGDTVVIEGALKNIEVDTTDAPSYVRPVE